MTTLDRLKPLIKVHAPVGEALVIPEARLTEDLGCDSLDRYELACDILEEFDVDLSNEVMASVHTVGELARTIDTAIAMKRVAAA